MGGTEIVIEPGHQDIVMTRVFDAPRDAVFRALTDPDLLAQWWGPKEYRTVVEHLDARPGGSWRMTHHGDQGDEYAFRGIFHDVAAPERMVQTFEYEGMPGHVSLETAVLEEAEGAKTRYVATSVFQSVADRDAMTESGMEEGARESMDRLAALVEKS